MRERDRFRLFISAGETGSFFFTFLLAGGGFGYAPFGEAVTERGECVLLLVSAEAGLLFQAVFFAGGIHDRDPSAVFMARRIDCLRFSFSALLANTCLLAFFGAGRCLDHDEFSEFMILSRFQCGIANGTTLRLLAVCDLCRLMSEHGYGLRLFFQTETVPFLQTVLRAGRIFDRYPFAELMYMSIARACKASKHEAEKEGD